MLTELFRGGLFKPAKGHCGSRGPLGLPGPAGRTGSAGAKGPRGQEGPEGFGGQAGVVGRTGPEGAPGLQGEMGAWGLPGSEGPKGEKANPGRGGRIGPRGTAGMGGFPGEDGLKGDQGKLGPHGPPGEKGDPGSTGELGQEGQCGRNGNPGLSGRPGVRHWIYPTGKLKDSLAWVITDRLRRREVKLLVDPPDGTKTRPAATCKELWISQLHLPDGYYIDPNQGSPEDGLLAFRNSTAGGATCISPVQNQVPVKAWLKAFASEDTFQWFSSLPGGFMLEYQSSSTFQLRFLKLHSSLATQKVSYACRPCPEEGQRHLEKEVKILADSRVESYVSTLQGCRVDNESSVPDTICSSSAEDLSLLPPRDLAVFHNGDASHQFGFTVGPACFS